MHPDTWAFLTSLFERCARPDEAYITFSALPPDERHFTLSRHMLLSDKVGQSDALERLIDTNRLGWGACVAIAPRYTNLGRYHRGRKQDLLELPALFVDLDQPAEALSRLAKFPLSPSCIVHSGRGIHAYWYLIQPTSCFDIADRALRGLAHHLGGDSMMTVAQSLRLPGTVNHKPGRNGAMCHLLDLHPERRYSLLDFAPYLAEAEQAKRSQSNVRRIGNSLTWEDAHIGDLNPVLVNDVANCLFDHYGGYLKPNGWIAALCPCGHTHDRPGKHFYFCAEAGLGWCWGRHGPMLLKDLCHALHIDLSSYGWIIKKAPAVA